jgi:hypothetical protein
MKIKLAEALLRRKELQEKLNVVRQFSNKDFFVLKATRRNITENIDDIEAAVPKLTLSQFTREMDHYARQLRLVDAAIQQANWTQEIEVNDTVMKDYEEKTEEEK